jgi:hypothetical protein
VYPVLDENGFGSIDVPPGPCTLVASGNGLEWGTALHGAASKQVVVPSEGTSVELALPRTVRVEFRLQANVPDTLRGMLVPELIAGTGFDLESLQTAVPPSPNALWSAMALVDFDEATSLRLTPGKHHFVSLDPVHELVPAEFDVPASENPVTIPLRWRKRAK